MGNVGVDCAISFWTWKFSGYLPASIKAQQITRLTTMPIGTLFVVKIKTILLITNHYSVNDF